MTDITKTVMRELAGSFTKLNAMIDVKRVSFNEDNNTLFMLFGEGRNHYGEDVNAVRIYLNENGLYNLEFLDVAIGETKNLDEIKDVEPELLKYTFENYTGLNLSK